jgi:hypothetical protein
VTDLETFLKSKLNESIDEELGPRRPAPPFTPSVPTRTWVRPVLAAASVLVVVGGAVAISRLATDSDSTTPSGTGNPTQPVATQQSNEPPMRQVQFHGAQIAVPDGWTAHPKQGDARTLCLSPAAQQSTCAITVTAFDPQGPAMLDVDEPSGFYGDPPQLCAPHPTPERRLTGAATRFIDGREAQWRMWQLDCPGGKTIVDDQYVVPSAPGFVFYAHDASSAVRADLDAVARQTQLPAQNAPLRLTDFGRVHSVASSSRNGTRTVHLVLSRFGPDGAIDHPETLISYDLSQAVYQRGDSPKVGTAVYLASDGHTVLEIEKRLGS